MTALILNTVVNHKEWTRSRSLWNRWKTG